MQPKCDINYYSELCINFSARCHISSKRTANPCAAGVSSLFAEPYQAHVAAEAGLCQCQHRYVFGREVLRWRQMARWQCRRRHARSSSWSRIGSPSRHAEACVPLWKRRRR